MRILKAVLAGLLLAAVHVRALADGKVAVAAAANLVYVLAPMNAAFEKANPGTTVTDEIGSSGSLVAMIANGAPYDVFLSADMDFPRKLVEQGGAEGSSLVPFVYGKLVLWTTRPGLVLSTIEAAVRDPNVQRIAIANPKTAPFGTAAEEALAKLRLSDVARPRIVTAENISQTAQYVSSGNADIGFVALSIVMAPKLKGQGQWIAVPDGLYTPIAEGGVLTKRGASNPEARSYLQFLLSPPAREIFAKYGYGLP